MLQSDVIATIAEAIRRKLPVSACYRGSLPRRLCPHVLGRKGGAWNVLCYQFAGASTSGRSSDRRDNWRCFKLEHLQHVAIVHDKWHKGSNHSRHQVCVDQVYVEVDF